MRIDLDTPVSCLDGAAGEVADVVIDPATRCLTHLVVMPNDRPEDARLMPIGGARDSDGSTGIELDCTMMEIRGAEAIHESSFTQLGQLPPVVEGWDLGIHDLYSTPELGSLGPEILGTGMSLEHDQNVVVSYHRVPKGGVEIRRASPVTSSDGHHLGHVVGFVIDDDKAITWLVLEHGHLWGKHSVAIPSRAIERFETDELVLNLTHDEAGALKPLPAHHHAG